ncbi:hypothetical protein HRbin36_02332 [bacterium HR36]|nr:hypothetical protein HRbin36_02332 [bacterium HR36]
MAHRPRTHVRGRLAAANAPWPYYAANVASCPRISKLQVAVEIAHQHIHVEPLGKRLADRRHIQTHDRGFDAFCGVQIAGMQCEIDRDWRLGQLHQRHGQTIRLLPFSDS